jgi:hypothetical protein
VYFQNTNQQKECNMCQKCNDSLLAAAQAASLLASAAKDLYDINQTAQAKTLAQAAAELFSIVKDDVPSGSYATTPGEAGTAAGDTGSAQDAPKDAAEKKEPRSNLPQGFTISDDGIMYINGTAVGRVVVIGPTKH